MADLLGHQPPADEEQPDETVLEEDLAEGSEDGEALEYVEEEEEEEEEEDASDEEEEEATLPAEMPTDAQSLEHAAKTARHEQLGDAVRKAEQHAAATPPAEETRPNSRSHRNAYKRFMRAAASAKENKEVIQKAMNGAPLDLFELYLQENEDVQRAACTLTMRRTAKKIKQAIAGSKYGKRKDVEDYCRGDEEKTNYVINVLTRNGLWYPDQFFPRDEQERWYALPQGLQFEELSMLEDAMEVETKCDLTNEEARDLVGSGGLMSLTDVPSTIASGADLAANTFSQVLAQEVKNAKCKKDVSKPKTSERAGGDASLDAQTPLQKANDLCNELLKKAGEAQKLASQIEPLQFSSDLVSFLKKFYQASMLVYKKVWPLVVKKAPLIYIYIYIYIFICIIKGATRQHCCMYASVYCYGPHSCR